MNFLCVKQSGSMNRDGDRSAIYADDDWISLEIIAFSGLVRNQAETRLHFGRRNAGHLETHCHLKRNR
jgi:hypothetical protein